MNITNTAVVELTAEEMPDRSDYIEGLHGEDCYVGEIEYRKALKRAGFRLPTNAEQRAIFESFLCKGDFELLSTFKGG